MMGIPVDYREGDYAARWHLRPPDSIPEPVLMLPIPKDWAASQECVGDNEKLPKRTAARGEKEARFAADVEVRTSPGGEWA